MTDRDDDGKRMQDRLSERFGGDESDFDSSDDANTSKESKSSKTGMPEETTSSEASISGQQSIKDLPSVLMYLPEDLHSRLDLRFDEVKLEHKREYGEEIEKNRHFYPALVKAGLEGKTVEEVLDRIDSEDE